MKTLLPYACAQLAIATTLIACSTSRPSITASPLPDVSSSPVISTPSPLPITVGDPFAKGVDKAASASSLAQSAQSADDWKLVLTQWQQAIAFMEAVPPSSPNHTAAQKLLPIYQQALVRTQQQAKVGGDSRNPIAAQGNINEGGIPLVSSSQSPISPEITKDATTTATATVNALLQQQTEFFAKQKRFAASIAELGSGVLADTSSYVYGTRILQSKQVVATATAKQDGLPSYTGTLFSVKDDKNTESTITTVCLTSKPSKMPPAVPQLIGKEGQCPAGSSKL